MPDITIISAFLGGILTFFAPCTLPLIPAFIAFIGGQPTGESGPMQNARRRIIASALCFILGFTVVFIFFGLASGALGSFLVLNKKLISQIGGVLIILLGLGMLRIIPLPTFPIFSRSAVPSTIHKGTRTGGFLLGLLFGLGWSPCLGPILGTILILAGSTGSAISGALLLLVYAMGLGLPFLLVAVLYGEALGYVTTLSRYLPLISKIGAVLVILIGLLMVVGQFGSIATYGFDIYRIPQFDHLLDLM